MNELIFEKDDIPKGWIMTEINEICELIGGGTPSRKNSKYFNGDIIWLTPTEIPKNAIVKIFDSKEKITVLGLKKSSAKIIPKNSVLLTSRASIGYIAIAGTTVTTNQGFASFVCSNVIHNFYLAYWLMSKIDLLKIQATGTTFKEISKSKLKLLSIFLPPLNEQKCIISKIESIFAQIDAIKLQLESVNISLKLYKQSVFRNLFFEKISNWIRADLETICESIRDGTHTPPKRTNSGIPLLSARNIENNGINWAEKFSFITEDDFKKITKNNSILKNDILLTIVGTIGRTCVVETDTLFTVQRSVAILKIHDFVIPDFVKYYFQSPVFFQTLQQKSRGVAQKGVYLADLKQLEFFYPDSIHEQKRIVSKIESIFGNIDTLNLFCFILRGNLFTNIRYFMILYMQHIISEQ